MSRDKGSTIYRLLILISVIACVIEVSSSNKPEYFRLLWILPAANAIILFIGLFINQHSVSNYCYLAFSAIFTIRNSISVILLKVGEYSCLFKTLNDDNVAKGLLLMIAETLIVIVFASCRSKFARINNEEQVNDAFDFSTKTLETIVFWLFILTIIATIIFTPALFNGYATIFSSSNIRTQLSDNFEALSGYGPLYTLFSVMFPIAYMYIAIYLLKVVNRTQTKGGFKTVLNLLVICIPLLFMGGGNGLTMICLFSLAVLALRMKGINKAVFGTVFGFGFVSLFIYLLIIIMTIATTTIGRSFNMWSQLSQAFQAYFPGVSNFAAFFNMQQHDKLQTLFYDIYTTIPFKNAMFGIPGDYRLVRYYCADNYTSSQIIPFICQGWYYLNLFSFFYELIVVNWAFKRYEKLLQFNDVYSFFGRIMLLAYLVCTPVMFNFTIFLQRFFISILPFFVFSAFFKRFYIGRRTEKLFRTLN